MTHTSHMLSKKSRPETSAYMSHWSEFSDGYICKGWWEVEILVLIWICSLDREVIEDACQIGN